MLTIKKLKKTLGGRTLFEEADMQINYGERVALVGPNGAGKSTLFSLILKKDEPDAGSIERDEWTMIGHLAQEGEATGEETVLDVATGRIGELHTLEKRLKELEDAGMAHFICNFTIGEDGIEGTKASIKLFAKEILPALKEKEPVLA